MEVLAVVCSKKSNVSQPDPAKCKNNINLMLGWVIKGLGLEAEVVGHYHIDIGLDGPGKCYLVK